MNTLTDRYLAATLRSVPTQRRDEIASELRASIEDMIEDRTGGGAGPPTAEREVLTELGNPDELAARYADRRLQLIGPTYYLVWLRLLKLLLSFIPALVGTIVAVVKVAEGSGFGAIGPGLVVALHVAVHIAFWLTLTFAIIERTQPAVDLPDWTVDQLPDAPVRPRHPPRRHHRVGGHAGADHRLPTVPALPVLGARHRRRQHPDPRPGAVVASGCRR